MSQREHHVLTTAITSSSILGPPLVSPMIAPEAIFLSKLPVSLETLHVPLGAQLIKEACCFSENFVDHLTFYFILTLILIEVSCENSVNTCVYI